MVRYNQKGITAKKDYESNNKDIQNRNNIIKYLIVNINQFYMIIIFRK